MKVFALLLCLWFAPAPGPVWLSDFNEAKALATKNQQYILINFAGTDWCGPCITMRKEIFGNGAFADYAGKHLVLVRADFPRLKKNLPSKEQMAKNEELAARYNTDGKFPYTVLVNANGKVLKQWDGLPDEKASAFVQDIIAATHVNP